MPNRALMCIATFALSLYAVTAFAQDTEPRFVNPLQFNGSQFGTPGATPELEIRTSLTAAKVAAGEEAILSVTVTLPQDYYIYSTNPSFGGATKIDVKQAAGLEPIDDGFKPDHEPKTVYEDAFEQTVEKFFDEVTWTRRYRISPNVPSDKIVVTGTLEGQYCSTGENGQCIPIRPPHEFKVALAEGEPGDVPPEATPAQPSEATSALFSYETIPMRGKAGKEKADPVSYSFALSPVDAGPGEEVTLTVTAHIDEGWHTFALTQDPEMAGKPTVIDVVSTKNLEPVEAAFSANHEPEIEKPLDNIVQQVHYREVTWSRKFKVLPGTEKGTYELSGRVNYQLCRNGTCLPPHAQAFALGMLDQPNVDAEKPDADVPMAAAIPIQDQGLTAFLMAAVAAGFLALLTPCVFPMVPVTVSFFLKQSEKEHHRPVRMALIYCFGIMATFTFLGVVMAAVFGATSLNQLANNPWLNLAIAGVLVFFGMNLLGMFEIRVPSSLLTWSAGKENYGGIVGTLFMSLTFTLVSFTCTFAFVGALVVWAANGEYYWPVIGMLAFSAAFALPFFFLALFPSFLKKLPKSGGWMNAVKVTMGMVEVGAAFKFLSVADLAWNPAPILFDFALVMSAWLIIAICTGLYLLGMFRLPHDVPSEHITVPRLTAAMLFLGFGGYLAVGLFADEKPRGKVWDQIVAFAPPTFAGGEGDIGPFLEHGDFQFALDYSQAVKFSQKENLPLFLDFTGVNCVNCRLMERKMDQPHNKEQLKKFVLVQLYTDNVPSIKDQQQVDQLLAFNRDLQENWFEDATLPAYAVVTPDGKTVLATFKGVERREGDFAEFLATGRENWQRQLAAKPPERTAQRVVP